MYISNVQNRLVCGEIPANYMSIGGRFKTTNMVIDLVAVVRLFDHLSQLMYFEPTLVNDYPSTLMR